MPTNTAPWVALISERRVQAGSSTTFSVLSVTGNPTPVMQWRKDEVDISGQNGLSITLTNIQPSDAGRYDLIATNDHGTGRSDQMWDLIVE